MTTDPAQLPLRDIQLPEPVSWWPPAPGWWLLALLAVLLLAGTALFLVIRRRTRLKRSALRELSHIHNHYLQHQDDALTIRELSGLLRRVCLSIDQRPLVASLTGAAWLQHLDSLCGGQQFSLGAGRLLTTAPYQRQPQHCAAELLEICRDWLNNLPGSRRR